jgi:acetolactate synthase-1/2/3 large subunit
LRFKPELYGKEGGKFVDPFRFIRVLSDNTAHDDVLAVGSSGTAPNTFLQAFRFKRGQQFVNCSTLGLMGADIPMAVGACIGAGKRRTICPTGDGSFMLNVQELAVISGLNLPVKFFVYANNGYASIRNMQNARFDGRHVACDGESDLHLPRISDDHTDTASIAEAFGIRSGVVSTIEQVKSWFASHYWTDSAPYILTLQIDPAYQQYPRVVNRLEGGTFVHTPMEDMTPEIDDLKELMSYD